VILVPLLGAAAAACSIPRAPGMSQTDVASISTENTGPYDVVEKRVENGTRYLRVEADQPQRYELIGRNLIAQVLPYSPQAIRIEISGRPGAENAGEKHTVTWQRGHHEPRPPSPSSPGTAPADHRGFPPGPTD
jgi:hypothetical protein